MNDQLDGRIRELLGRLDDLTPLPPSFDELAGPGDRRGDGPRNRWRPGVTIAAVTVMLVSLAGLVWVVQSRSTGPAGESPAPTTMPSPPPPSGSIMNGAPPVSVEATTGERELEGFPALDPADPRNETAEASYARIGDGRNPRTSALVAQRDGDRITEGIAIMAQRDWNLDAFDHVTSSTTIDGVQVDYVVEPGDPPITTAVVRTQPSIAYVGIDPIAFLRLAGTDATRAIDDGIELEIGSLPDGYEVIVEPEPFPARSLIANLALMAGDTADGTLVTVQTSSPMIVWGAAGDLQAVDVNGVPGWMTTRRGHYVMWPIGEHTWATVGGNAAPETSLEVARAVQFVDEATWRARYGVAEPTFPSTPPRPAPPVASSIPHASSTDVPSSTSIVASPSEAIDLDEGRVFGIPTISPVDVGDTIALVSGRLGATTADTGWLPMPAEFACTGNLAFRTVWWHDFRMTFEQQAEGEVMTAWSLGDPAASQLAPIGDVSASSGSSGVTTVEGIGIGMSAEELHRRVADRVVTEDSPTAVAVMSGPLVVQLLLSDGSVSGIGSGRNDCIGEDGDL